MRNFLKIWFLLLPVATVTGQPTAEHNLRFDSLARRWDEAMPLGNGLLGALIWLKDDQLRMSLDRVDLWDDRPMPGIDQFTFKWVTEKVRERLYDTVQKIGDLPYETFPAPTKIPGAALEFDITRAGRVVSNILDIKTGINKIKFLGGGVLKTYVHAILPAGYFMLENMPDNIVPVIKIPAYHVATDNPGSSNSVEGQSLQRVGYARGMLIKEGNTIRYRQPIDGNNYYEVLVSWKKTGVNQVSGQWTISNNKPARLSPLNFTTALHSHINWWKDYWQRSSVHLPEAALEKEYYLDMYKFGSVARSNTPPVSLQAVWTADNNLLPPWKGDFHHDLNTQLSYWPGYTSNHLDLTAGFTNWLWKVKDENIRWTRQYFGVDGLNVPGVTTITGKPMGGWIQYALSPTTAAWLCQHFYWQWKYSNDDQFLKEKCKPYFDEVVKYLNAIMIKDSVSGKFQLPLSSSPEHNNNDIDAWFKAFTNYDLALIRYCFEKYGEILEITNKNKSNNTPKYLDNYPLYDADTTGLTIAPGKELEDSHRHHSHLISIYPLKNILYDRAADKSMIDKSLSWLAKKGTRNWVGYSFPWAACLYAQTGNGDSAVAMLRKFAGNFVSANSFHLNGDQKGGQYADATYRPFTLEGNFAFAQAIHELLIQSHKGYIEIFGALPQGWENVSFSNLRTEGAFLVSASKKNGQITRIEIKSETGGTVRIRLPFTNFKVPRRSLSYHLTGGIFEVRLRKGESFEIENIDRR